MKKEIIILSLVTCFLFLGAGSSQMFLIPYLSNSFAETQSSLVLATVYISIILGVFLNVFLKEIRREKKRLFGLTGYVLFPLSVFLTREYFLLILSSIYWGVTATFYWVSTISTALDFSEEKDFGTNSGMIFFGSGIGTFFGTIMLSRVQETYGYDFIFLAATLLSILAFLPILFLGPDAGNPFETIELRDLLVTGGNKMIPFFIFIGYYGYGIIMNSVSSAVASTLGPSMIGVILSGYFLVSALFSVYGGRISDTLGRRKTFVLAFSSGAAGLLLGSVILNPVTLAVLCVLLGFQVSTVPVNAYGWIGEKTKTGGRLSSICSSFIWNSAAVTVSLLSSSIVYELSGSHQTVFFSFGIISLICGIISNFLK
ncbi:MAG: MFS transporter [Thermoproteota archaeon]